ncbi:hypothetical protein [Nocardioides cynanchi]|uniref:hypothetical protein n=1 Tax=Nocardioides cynanchi TaxID=2558918 RepID=UPI0012460E67|nr:hypothetical protein [Nocardioides cynanchi]
MQIRTWRLGIAAAGAAAVLAAAPAGAATQWTDYRSSDFTLAAGAVCSFPLQGHVVADQERYRPTETYPDGSPRVQEFTGRLVVEYTNLDTGASVTRNLTGRSDFEYLPDGSFTLTDVGGHFAVGLHPGDSPSTGFYVVNGVGSTVSFAADGHRTLTVSDGSTVENLCQTLA